MSLRINTNLASINAQRKLNGQQKRVEDAQAKLASGNRIIRASDDAAGLAISEQMRGQIAGIRKAKDNANNAQSLIQIGEGALNEVSNILIRMRELSVQSASDTVSDSEREFLNQEMTQLQAESDRIAQTTKFGNKTLLDGSTGELEFQVGPNGGESNVIRLDMETDASAGALGIDSLSLADKGGARDSLESIDDAMQKVGSIRANYGAFQSRLQTTVGGLENQYENLSAAKSRISDADIAEEAAELTSATVLQQAATSVLGSANQNGAAALRLIG